MGDQIIRVEADGMSAELIGSTIRLEIPAAMFARDSDGHLPHTAEHLSILLAGLRASFLHPELTEQYGGALIDAEQKRIEGDR